MLLIDEHDLFLLDIIRRLQSFYLHLIENFELMLSQNKRDLSSDKFEILMAEIKDSNRIENNKHFVLAYHPIVA